MCIGILIHPDVCLPHNLTNQKHLLSIDPHLPLAETPSICLYFPKYKIWPHILNSSLHQKQEIFLLLWHQESTILKYSIFYQPNLPSAQLQINRQAITCYCCRATQFQTFPNFGTMSKKVQPLTNPTFQRTLLASQIKLLFALNNQSNVLRYYSMA